MTMTQTTDAKGMHMAEVLELLAFHKDLPQDMADESFRRLMDGTMSPAQAGAFLMGLKTKGETARELTAAVNAALAHARLVPGLSGARIDTCGTGGDATCSFNCSTVVALTLAGMGYKVVKHGNRSVSSTCGSADALEAVGLSLTTKPEAVAGELERCNFAFLFAPEYHPAFRHIMPVRKEIGCRTLFNMLGPLLNPARPTHQLLGVALPQFLLRMATVLANTGVRRAAVVHGAGGFDELTPFGVNRMVEVRDGWLREAEFDPADYGFARHAPEAVAVTGRDEAVAVLREVLAGGGPEAMRDMAALNVGMCVHLLEDGMDMAQAMDAARAALAAGAGERVLHA
ncbi:anthranilate phosphoribosyltransferase [Desulfobaculum xiamenense]|uniref:Anthranilate phosphoribosyltransferase n=1 Tax=Desulfobaculum xiamenense TaxID=995050 RepID=A0A846QS54_9BACT|nr:anthranilate phosphoribosyltransferase [Desulfobaculum xiamenense]NJB68265.1 anthranilate phosphoribosyltransferase [Desulfobaculum xiamenense]